MHRQISYKRVATRVTFSANTKEPKERPRKSDKTAGISRVRQKDAHHFNTCISDGAQYHQKRKFIEALAQFSLVINAPGAPPLTKADAYEKRAALYQDFGKPEKAEHDRQLAVQLKSRV